jgi:hypothetical protein
VITHLAATAANCTTGTWAQRWQCNWNAGWHQPATATVTRAGFDFGHNALPVLIMLAFVLLAIKARRRTKVNGRTAEPAAKAWERAKMPVRRSES